VRAVDKHRPRPTLSWQARGVPQEFSCISLLWLARNRIDGP